MFRDAKKIAVETGEDWSSLTLAEKLNRVDSDEGHAYIERYFGVHDPTDARSVKPHWSILLVRFWLYWSIGISVQREIWSPDRLHITVDLGPFSLILMREWGRSPELDRAEAKRAKS